MAIAGAGSSSRLSTGVLTFCMSDVEGSTRLWESHPEAAAAALARHDALIAAVVENHGGVLVKSMGEGDSTASVFASATEAVRAAIAANRALQAEPWPAEAPIRVRFGLHTGEAESRDGVYLGPTPNMAARVRGAGDGGEILLSETTAALIADDLPPEFGIVDLGLHRLKGIAQPQALKALTGPGLLTGQAAAECPYRGLLPFEPRHRHLFFGREDALNEVLQRIVPGQLLAVVGASGSGKSSLLRAGVLAAVAAGELVCASAGRLLTPGPRPPLELAEDEHDLLVVDQLEELYTQCQDERRRSTFIRALLGHQGPVLIGLRADFYGEISRDPALAKAVAENQILLGPMREEELWRAIAEPARLAGLRFEPGLIDLVLRDVSGEAGALPLMSHALRETWERRNGRTLTVEAYQATGGVSSALAQTADALVAATPAAERPLLRNLFLRLTEIGGEVEDARRRVPIEDLVPEDSSAAAVRNLLRRLADARLITLDDGTAQVAHEVLIRRWPRLRRWLDEDRDGLRLHRRLSEAARLWHTAGRESSDLYRGTRLDAAVEWARLHPGALNQTERDFLTASQDEAASTERVQLRANRRLRRALGVSGALLLLALGLLAFALVSRHTAVGAETSARSQAVAALASAQLSRDPERSLLLGRIALHDAPTAQAELAVSEALDASTLRAQLPPFGIQGCQEANFLFLFNQGRLAADNTCNGYVVFADLVHRRIVRRVRVGARSTDMILGPDRRSLIVATGRQLVSVDVASGHVRRLFTGPFVIEQLAGPPGASLAIADKYRIGLVDLRHGRVRMIARGDPSLNVINGMMWASTHTLLVASLGETRGEGQLYPGLTVLDTARGARATVSLDAAPYVADVSFLRVSPDRRTWFITGAEVNPTSSSQLAATWAINARTRRLRWVARGPLGATASPVQASPDGQFLAVGYDTGAADVLNAQTGRLVVRDSSSASIGAGDVAFPAGDGSLVTVSLDGVIRIWSARGSEELRFEAPPDPGLGFTPNGRDLVLAGARGERVDRRSGRVVGAFGGFPAGLLAGGCGAGCFAAAPGLRWLSYLDPNSAIPRITEIAGDTGRTVGSVVVPRLDAQGVAPNGQIGAAYVDGDRLFAELIDPRTHQVRPLAVGASSDGCAATAPSFTSDSRLMAVVDGCIHLTVWNLHSGRISRQLVLPDRSNNSPALLAPDDRYVLLPVMGGAFLRVDLRSGKATEVPGGSAEADLLAASPDGRFYAVGRQDGAVDVYDTRTLELVRHHTLVSAAIALAFSPDSRALAVEDASHVVRVWDTCAICENPRALAAMAAKESVRQLTPGERRTFAVS